MLRLFVIGRVFADSSGPDGVLPETHILRLTGELRAPEGDGASEDSEARRDHPRLEAAGNGGESVPENGRIGEGNAEPPRCGRKDGEGESSQRAGGGTCVSDVDQRTWWVLKLSNGGAIGDT